MTFETIVFICVLSAYVHSACVHLSLLISFNPRCTSLCGSCRLRQGKNWEFYRPSENCLSFSLETPTTLLQSQHLSGCMFDWMLDHNESTCYFPINYCAASHAHVVPLAISKNHMGVAHFHIYIRTMKCSDLLSYHHLIWDQISHGVLSDVRLCSSDKREHGVASSR